MELVTAVHCTSSRPSVEPSRRAVHNGGSNDRRDVFHVSFAPGEESPPVVLLEAVEVINDTPVESLPPLERAIDPDALSALVVNASTTVEITFTYESLDITMSSDGHLWLQRT